MSLENNNGTPYISILPKAEESKYMEQTEELLKENISENDAHNIFPGKRIGKRHWQVLNICFLVFVAYYSRNSLSVAIVAMNDRNSTINPDIQTYNWTNKNVVLSAFFFGYVPSQILTSWLISQIGVKWFGIFSISICSISGMLTPQFAGWFADKGIIAVRVIQGLTQGFVFPSVQHLMAQWVPANERAGLGGTVYAARPVATVVSMLLSGYIAASWYGWPMIFYSSNILGILWCLSSAIYSYDNPAKHPSISAQERKYIEKNLGQQDEAVNKKIPWKDILLSGPFWAVTITQAGFSWGFWTQQTQTPMYMKYVMKFNIENSGTLSALPYLLQWLLCYVFSFSSDYLLNKNFWTISTARKTMNSIGMFVPAITFIILSNFGPNDSTKAIVLLVIGIAVNGACFCGFMVNQMDLSPRFASVLVGISNGPGQVTGFLAPLFVQAVVKNDDDPDQWKYVFYTAAGIYIASGIIFLLFGSGEVQYWDNLEEYRRKQINSKRPDKLEDGNQTSVEKNT